MERQKTRFIAVAMMAAMAAGCSSSSDGTVVGGVAGSTTSSGVVNDGTLATSIVNGGVPVTGNFICTNSAVGVGVNTVTGANGLVGGVLSGLLAQLGLSQVAAITNSVSTPEAMVDGNLDTYASVTLAAGLGGTLVNSVDESAVFSSQSAFGVDRYTVFALSFPAGLTNAAVFNNIRISTFLGDQMQETNPLTRSALNALGLGPQPAIFLGLRANKPYNRVTLSVVPDLVTANLGPVVRIHELCLDGRLVAPPAAP